MLFRLSAISDAEFWDDMIPDSMGEAAAMPTYCPRVLKTHLSFDMLPNQVMERRNKVRDASKMARAMKLC